jgi:hypothetical protein
MVKLRNISGNNLAALEKTLEEISLKQSIMIHTINSTGGQWYIHFLLVEPENDPTKLGVKIEDTREAKIPKKKGSASL